MIKLNLGCGQKYKEGWVNVDLSEKDIYGNKVKVDVEHDLEKIPYPFIKGKFGYILVQHVIEHLAEPQKILSELWRISKKGGIIELRVPHFSFYGTYRDPTHKHIFSLESIEYLFDKKEFEIVKKKLKYSHNSLLDLFSFFININSRIYERFFAWIFPCQECVWIIKVKK